jgi:hypothetical protein
MAHRDDNRVYAENNSGNLFAHVKDARVYGPGGQSPDTLELQRRIEELQRLLTQHAAALPDAERLRQVTQELGNQLQDPQPNRTVVRSLLDSLTAGAGSVTAVLTAVTGLTEFTSRVL